MSAGLAGVDYSESRNAELAAISDLIEEKHRDKLRRIRELRGEQSRRQREERIRYFKPHTKQDSFSRSLANIRVLTGGNRSGKSAAGCAEAVAHGMGYRPWLPKSDPAYYVTVPDGHGGRKSITIPNRGLAVGESFGEQVKKVFIRKLLGDIETGEGGLLPKPMLKATKKNPQGVIVSITLTNGSVIDLQSYEQDSALFESTDYTWAWLDEPPPRPHFIAIKRGLTDAQGPMWITMTPLKEAWLYKDVVQREDVDTWAMSIWDNVGFGLTHEAAEDFVSYLDDDEREMREHGRFFHLMGLIYKMYGRIHRIPRWSHPRTGSQTIPADWGMWMAIDPHPRTPHHALWAAVRPDSSIFVVGELKNTHRGNLTSSFAEDILTYERDFLRYDSGNIERLIDPLATTPNPHGEEESILDDFADNGVECEVGSKQRDVGIGRTKKLLYHDQDSGVYPMLYFYNDLPIIHDQMGTYQWADHSKAVSRRKDDLQEPIKKNDHMVENLHRIILDNPEYRGFASQSSRGNLDEGGQEGSCHSSEFSTGY